MQPDLWLVVNGASGGNSASTVSEVVAALTSVGAAPARLVDAQAGLPRRADLEQTGLSRLAVFAGDGTVNGLATGIEGWGGALLVLPGGTANLLARTLHGEEEAPAIAARLPQMACARRTCIRSTGLVALVEVLAGPGATWSDVREEMWEGGVGEVAGAAVAAIRESTTGPMVALAEPALGRAEGYAGVRLEVAGDGMAVEGYGADTIGDYLRHGIALLRRDFRKGPHDELGHHRKVACRSLGNAPLPLMVDGERREGGPVQQFSLANFALDLFVSHR